MAKNQTECSRLEQRSVVKFSVTEESKSCEIYRKMCDVNEVCFSQKMLLNVWRRLKWYWKWRPTIVNTSDPLKFPLVGPTQKFLGWTKFSSDDKRVKTHSEDFNEKEYKSFFFFLWEKCILKKGNYIENKINIFPGWEMWIVLLQNSPYLLNDSHVWIIDENRTDVTTE